MNEITIKLFKKWWFWIILVAFLFFALAVSIIKGNGVLLHYTDFTGFYTAGWHFIKGMPLYGQIYSHIPPFIYPPFAALLFSIFAYSSPLIAYSFFCFFNLILYPLTLLVMIKITQKFGYETKKMIIPLIFALILSARYFRSNFFFGQIDSFLLVLILLGILCYLSNKSVLAAILISVTICIKMIPIIFLIWIVIRKFNFKIVFATVATILISLLLPFLFRGIDQSVADLNGFYSLALKPYLFDHSIIIINNNQSLMGAIGRLFVDFKTESVFATADFIIRYQYVKLIILAVDLVLLSLLSFLIYNKIKRKIPADFLEFALVFLCMHLLSSVTWVGHLVSMLFVLIPLFLVWSDTPKRVMKIFIVLLSIVLFAFNFDGITIAGVQLRVYYRGYSLYTIMLISLFVIYYFHSIKAVLIKIKMKTEE